MNPGNDNSGEILPNLQNPNADPHDVRRGVRYAAASNTKAAIASQYPGQIVTQTVATLSDQGDEGDDDVAKTV